MYIDIGLSKLNEIMGSLSQAGLKTEGRLKSDGNRLIIDFIDERSVAFLAQKYSQEVVIDQCIVSTVIEGITIQTVDFLVNERGIA